MVKLFRIPGTDVKIRLTQTEELRVYVTFDYDDSVSLSPKLDADKRIIRALGLPTSKPPKPQPIDGGDLEEVTE